MLCLVDGRLAAISTLRVVCPYRSHVRQIRLQAAATFSAIHISQGAGQSSSELQIGSTRRALNRLSVETRTSGPITHQRTHVRGNSETPAYVFRISADLDSGTWIPPLSSRSIWTRSDILRSDGRSL